ncbi:hypothetical protein GCM10009677_17560 [Sphaerisporangium rubeum]|uniref:ATP-binding protein n=1 Tax=Sphaerisporangium rubeum TaxID=321317 RepID=UPI003382BDBD
MALITRTAPDGHPVIEVTNTGTEVPAGAVERLFKPFQRLEPERTGRAEGLGLGLSIVQAMAEAHHATIEARPRTTGSRSVRITFHY